MTAEHTPDNILKQIPDTLRDELLRAFKEVLTNFRERRWEPSELNGGKFCEVVYSIICGHVDGSFPEAPKKPKNMVDACRSLEQTSTTVPRSIRIQIPRVLISLYEVRNNRGVGHIGGDVDPNHMDALMVLESCKWVLAELIRIFHDVDTQSATTVVEALLERDTPLVWEIGNKKRILNVTLTMKDKTLLLLYSEPDGISEEQLVDWLEHSNASVYRRDVLATAHKARLIEYDRETEIVHISPVGIRRVEEKLLEKL